MKINRPRNFGIDQVIQGKRLCTSYNRCDKCRRVLLEEGLYDESFVVWKRTNAFPYKKYRKKKKKNKCLNREQICSNVQPFETFRNIMKRYRYKKKERETKCTFKYLSQLKNLLN